MNELIAKKYVKALLESCNKTISSIETIYRDLNNIAIAYKSEKFQNIISSIDVSNDKKVEFVLSFLTNQRNVKVKNLIKLLGEKKRLNIIPFIVKELKEEIGRLKNIYEGIVYTNKKLDVSYISSLEKEFSKKFKVDLKLVQNVCEYDGIKVDIEGLGVEIGFSKERLKTQIIDHILKAV